MGEVYRVEQTLLGKAKSEQFLTFFQDWQRPVITPFY